jgi:arylsulfatase A-like enzyme
MGRTRHCVQLLLTTILGGGLTGSLAAAIDWQRILFTGDFVEPVTLNLLWLTVTAAGAASGLVLGLTAILALVPLTWCRGRPLPELPGGFRLPAALLTVLLVLYLGLWLATLIVEGRLPTRRIDLACSGEPESAGVGRPGKIDTPPISVILLVLDTVRADHLSLYGYHRPTTPELEKLAGESLVCDSARSTASWTLPAHGSLFTGLYPSQHRMHGYGLDDHHEGQPLLAHSMAAGIMTLPMLLRRAGLQTAALYANPVLSPRYRLDRGFDLYLSQTNYNSGLALFTEPILAAAPWSGWLETFRKSTPSARQITRRVTHWLDHHAQAPFFLFVNYMDAHWPYMPPPPYDTLYPGKGDGRPSKDELRTAILGRQRELTGEELAFLHSQYDGAIRYLDSQLGFLMDHLRKRGIFDSSLIIVTSDHGEFFGEHQLVFHGRELYEEGVKIPLLVKYPAGTPRGKLSGPVGLEDLFPTILQVLGQPIPRRLSGVPLGSARTGPTVAENHYSFKFDLKNPEYGTRFDRIRRSLVIGRHKFIHSSDGRNEFYDLQADPGETTNLLTGNPGLAEPFLAWVETLEQAATRPRTPQDLTAPRSRNSDRELRIRKQLAELGYVEEETP